MCGAMVRRVLAADLVQVSVASTGPAEVHGTLGAAHLRREFIADFAHRRRFDRR